jgi:hypothetical protein
MRIVVSHFDEPKHSATGLVPRPLRGLIDAHDDAQNRPTPTQILRLIFLPTAPLLSVERGATSADGRFMRALERIYIRASEQL